MSLINQEYANELGNLLQFAEECYTLEESASIFRSAEKSSYYLNSEEVQKFPEQRIMEYDFSNPMQLEQILKKVWTTDSEMRKLIPTVKVATFKLKDKYDNKFKDLSLYNYTL